MIEEIILNKPGKKVIFLGNEAIVRGALEAGVNFVSTYPGTPASEIGNIFFHLLKTKRYFGYFEFATNEKVALESGIGASMAGRRVLVAMKNFGLNVCLDALLPFAYTGTRGPTVIVVADDPNCHSSAQSEENTRFLAQAAHLPILEPSDPAEARDFVKLAFQLSAKYQLPIIIRTTTRVAHQRAVVKLEKFSTQSAISSQFKNLETTFIRNRRQWVTMVPRVLEMKKRLLAKIKKIKELSEKSKINQIENSLKIRNWQLGIVTSGISYLYVIEGLKELNLKLPVLKLGFFHPLPEEKIKKFIQPLKQVLVVEELEPYLEKEVERLAKQVNCQLVVKGKNFLPLIGELKPEHVVLALAKLTNKKLEIGNWKLKITNIKHVPRFCPGCPYWSVMAAVKKAVPAQIIFGGDIGCYMLAGMPPHQMQDYLFCMGASIGIAHGLAKSLEKNIKKSSPKPICFIGDSTFFHAGIPALINTIFNKSNPLIIILDNGITAMTGHQPNPGNTVRSETDYQLSWTGPTDLIPNLDEKPISIEDIVRACRVKNLKVVNSFQPNEIEAAVKEFLPVKEAAVIICRGLCALLAKSLKK